MEQTVHIKLETPHLTLKQSNQERKGQKVVSRRRTIKLRSLGIREQYDAFSFQRTHCPKKLKKSTFHEESLSALEP